MQIRTCAPGDIQKVRHFVSKCKPLGVHTGYTYWVLFHNFSGTCFVMEEEGKIVGYVSGMKSSTFDDVFFLWQIGVAEEMRGKGYSYLLLQKVLEAAKKMRCTKMQMSLEEKDGASFHAINGFAKKHNLNISVAGEARYPHSVNETMYHDTLYEIAI
jgi:L-2,4-diaminobutyric acid acetyltransferase